MQTNPGIPGEDVPLTPEEEAHFEQLAKKLRHTPLQWVPQKQIVGGRQLSDFEVDIVNTIKEHGAKINDLVGSVQIHVMNQRREGARLYPVACADAELKRIDNAEPARWAAIARTHFQEGLMALTRAVAQPPSF